MCERLIEGRRQINVFNYDWKYFYTISFITALCILCFIASFRADIIGADHINYIYEYKNINKTGDAYFSEKGYVLLCRIISELSQCNIAYKKQRIIYNNSHFNQPIVFPGIDA